MKYFIVALLFLYAYAYQSESSISSSRRSIHDYGWQSSTRENVGFDNFMGGTRGPSYQFTESTYTRDCGLGCTQYAKTSDFGTLDSRDLHPDHNYAHVDYDRNYDHDRNYE